MTVEILMLFGIIVIMMGLKVTKKLPADTLSIIVMCSLIVGEFVSPEESVSRLSNPAVVTVLCLMILTVGLESTGLINTIGDLLKDLLKGKEWKSLPIVIAIAGKLDMSPEPLLITIMFAANMSFITPLGYQTNTLVYGVGNYKFRDFIKVGGLLSLIIWVVASLLIPYLYMK